MGTIVKNQVPAVCFQLSGDRDDPGVSAAEDVAFTLPANPMSDRGQAVVYSFKPGMSEDAGALFVSKEVAPTLQGADNGSTRTPAVAYTENNVRFRCGSCGEEFTDKHASGIGGLAPAECPKCGEEETIELVDPRKERFRCVNCGTRYGIDDYERNPTCPKCGCMSCDDFIQGDMYPKGQPIAFAQNTREEVRDLKDCAGAISSEPGTHQSTYVAQVQWASGGGKVENPTAQSLRSGAEHNYQFLRQAMSVRRLTPRECERLQGFPDDYTLIPYKGKLAADGPRYKALGNSMAVPVVEWILRRIGMVARMVPKP